MNGELAQTGRLTFKKYKVTKITSPDASSIAASFSSSVTLFPMSGKAYQVAYITEI